MGLLCLISCEGIDDEGPVAITPLIEPARREITAKIKKGTELIRAGKFSEAAVEFRAGLELAEQAGDAAWESRCLVALGNVEFRHFRFQEAMATYLRAREKAEASGDKEASALISANLSSLYFTTGAHIEARRENQIAREALEAAPDSRIWSSLLLQQALLTGEAGDFQEAVPLYWQALETAERHGDIYTQAKILETYAYELILRGAADDAEKVLTEAYRIRKMQTSSVPSHYFHYFSILKRMQADYEASLSFMELAFQVARDSGRAARVWCLYYDRALIYAARGNHEKALNDLGQAVQLMEDSRLHLLPADSVRVQAGIRPNRIYQALIRTADLLNKRTGETKFARLAFETAERGRSLALREAVNETGELRQSLPPEYWEILNRAEALEGRLFGRDLPAEQERLAKLRGKLTEMEIEAGLRVSAGRTLSGSLSLAEIQNALGESDVLLSFSLAEPNSYLWEVTTRGFRSHRLPGRESLEMRIQEFRDAVEESSETSAELGESLYHTLLGDLSHEAESRRRWVLSLDGALFELPFSALVPRRSAGQPVYLIEEHSLRMLPGTGLLGSPVRERWKGPMVAIGDPIYNFADARIVARQRTDSGWRARLLRGIPFVGTGEVNANSTELARLAGSGAEVNRLVEICGSAVAEPRCLTGEKANSQDLRSALRMEPSVLHFATHVVPGVADTRQGHIALSLRGEGGLELLGPAVVSKLRVRSRLVTMSGCGSGRGRVLRGEGLIGLTRAWLRAGAESVAATLWPAPDGTGELIRSFYGHLGLGGGPEHSMTSPAEALRLAQIEMLRSDGWLAQPRFWANYFVVSRN